MSRSSLSTSSVEFESEDEAIGPSGNGPGAGFHGRLLRVLVGRWYWIVLGAILGTGGGLYYLSKATRIYGASSLLLVKQQSYSLLDKSEQQDLDMRSTEALNTVAEQLRRRSLMVQVAGNNDLRRADGLMTPPVQWVPSWLSTWLGLDPPVAVVPVPPAEELAALLSGKLEISVKRATRLIEVRARHARPQVAKQLADLVALEYIREITESRSDGRTSSISVLRAESERVRADLQAARKTLGGYEQALKMHAALELLDEESSRLARRYLPKHPKMIEATMRRDQASKKLLDELNRLSASGIDPDFWAAVKQEREAGNAVSEMDRLDSARRVLLSRAAVLQRETGSQEAVFEVLLTKLQETDVNRAAEDDAGRAECELSSLAVLPEHPESPRTPMVLVASATAGSGLFLVAVLIASLLDNKFRSVSQLEALAGYPVLAAVPNILPSAVRREAARRGGAASQSDSKEMAGATWDPCIVFRPGLSTTRYAEAYRVLRASVSLLGDESLRKVVLFTSAIPGEGKSLTSVNFSLAAAALGKSVLLVDLDLRKPSLHRAFGRPADANGGGITGFLAGQQAFDQSICRDSGVAGLDLVLSGTRAPNPGELLDGKKIAAFLEEARARYDLIVLDSAPLLAVPETRIIAPLADNRCLVVRADATPVRAVQAAIALLREGNAVPAGLVFNGFSTRRRIPGYGYYSYYGAGHQGGYDYGYGGRPYGEDAS